MLRLQFNLGSNLSPPPLRTPQPLRVIATVDGSLTWTLCAPCRPGGKPGLPERASSRPTSGLLCLARPASDARRRRLLFIEGLWTAGRGLPRSTSCSASSACSIHRLAIARSTALTSGTGAIQIARRHCMKAKTATAPSIAASLRWGRAGRLLPALAGPSYTTSCPISVCPFAACLIHCQVQSPSDR